MNIDGISAVSVLFLVVPIVGILMGIFTASTIVQSRSPQYALRMLIVLGLIGALIGMLAAAPRALSLPGDIEVVFVVWWLIASALTVLLAGAAIAGGIGGAIRHRQLTFLVPAAIGILAIFATYIATSTELIWPYARW